MKDEEQVSGQQEDLSEEEEPVTQRFSVVVVWSPESGGRLDADELRAAIEQPVLDVDEQATVEVTEIAEPRF